MGIFRNGESRSDRRSFIWKLGAGASAAVASTVGMARVETSSADSAARRVAQLEEEKILRRLHQSFQLAMDRNLPEEVIGMFADDAQVVFNGGVFRGRQGVSRLYRYHFPSGKSGVSLQQAPGFELTADQQRDSVEVAADLRTATAVFPYSIQVGVPFETESSLAAMARLHGEGVRTWWEGGVYKAAYRKDAAGSWKISRLEYDTLSRADWRSGKRYAQPISVARLSMRFPADQQGPDELV
jgi:carotenoid cleavage dioxygenase